MYQVEGVDYVECKICHIRKKSITGQHIQKHGLTFKEYKKIYDNPVTLINLVREKFLGENNGMKKESARLKLSNSKKGIPNYKIRGVNNVSKNEVIRKKISNKVKQSYINNPDLREIRATTWGKSTFTKEYREKMYDEGKWVRPENKSDWENYCRKIRQLTKKNFKKYYNEIPDADFRSRKNHLDHMYSVYSGFINKIPIEIIAHYKNFRIVKHDINESKGTNNIITINKLIEEIKNSKEKLNNETIKF